MLSSYDAGLNNMGASGDEAAIFQHIEKLVSTHYAAHAEAADNRIAELESQLAESNHRLAAAEQQVQMLTQQVQRRDQELVACRGAARSRQQAAEQAEDLIQAVLADVDSVSASLRRRLAMRQSLVSGPDSPSPRAGLHPQMHQQDVWDAPPTGAEDQAGRGYRARDGRPPANAACRPYVGQKRKTPGTYLPYTQSNNPAAAPPTGAPPMKLGLADLADVALKQEAASNSAAAAAEPPAPALSVSADTFYDPTWRAGSGGSSGGSSKKGRSFFQTEVDEKICESVKEHVRRYWAEHQCMDVVCGDVQGIFMLHNQELLIRVGDTGPLVSTNRFEELAGKKTARNWQQTIRLADFTLSGEPGGTLMKLGHFVRIVGIATDRNS